MLSMRTTASGACSLQYLGSSDLQVVRLVLYWRIQAGVERVGLCGCAFSSSTQLFFSVVLLILCGHHLSKSTTSEKSTTASSEASTMNSRASSRPACFGAYNRCFSWSATCAGSMDESIWAG